MRFQSLALLLTAAAVTTAAQPATAHPAAAAPQVVIAHADLDLTRASDAQTMLRRIRKAAVSVCQNGNDIATIERFEACYRQSIGRAVGTLNANLVTAAAGREGFVALPTLLSQADPRPAAK